MEWISEAEKLPPVGQPVLLLVPRQGGEFWDMHVAQLLIRYEGVAPRPVAKGGEWTTEYWWSTGNDPRRSETILVTGNSLWASYFGLPLPAGAEHAKDHAGRNYIAQPHPVWVGRCENVRS